jgi:WD40 repeat protein
VLERILYWTNGHPYLTQRLCQAVATGGNVTTGAQVDELCETLFLSRAARERDDNLLFVRERLLKSGADLAALLGLYGQVLDGKQILVEGSDPLVDLLLLSGIVRKTAPIGVSGARLLARNRIYERVFDRAWVAAQMPDAELRRQREAYRAGLLRAASAAGVVVAVVAALAFAAVQQAGSANRSARRAQQAEREANKKLWESYLAQARALRWSGRPGRRFDSLDAVERATAIEPSLELRNEAIASMALVDLRLVRQRETLRGNTGVVFDPRLERYAVGDKEGNIRVHRSEDGRELWSGREVSTWIQPVCFSPDGRFLAGDYEQREKSNLGVWDLVRRKTLIRVPDGVHSAAVSFSPDSRRVAACQVDGTVHLYDLRTAKETARFTPGIHLDGVRFDPSGRRLALSSFRAPGVQIRDAATGALRMKLSAPTPIRRVAWRSDGALLAGAGADWKVYLWEPNASQEPVAVLHGHTGEVVEVDFRGDGDLLVSSSWDDMVRLWDVAARSPVTRFVGVTARFAPDGQRLGVIGTGNEVQIWELAGGRECRTFRHAGALKGPYDMDLSPDGRLLASAAENGARVWDLHRNRQLGFLPGRRTDTILFSPSARELTWTGEQGLQQVAIRLPASVAPAAYPREPGARAPTRSLDAGGSTVLFGPPVTLVPGPIERAAMSRDGRTVAVTQYDKQRNGVIHIFYRGKPGWKTRLRPEPATEHYVAVSPDGRWVASGTWQPAEPGTRVQVWEARTGRLLRELPVWGNVDVAFSPDGKWLATMTGREYRLWSVGSWRPGPAFARAVAERNPGILVFSHDGTMAAVGHSPGVVQLIDLKTGEEFARLEAPNMQRSAPSCFSRDGSLLATRGDPELMQVWDLRLIQDRLRAMRLGWTR